MPKTIKIRPWLEKIALLCVVLVLVPSFSFAYNSVTLINNGDPANRVNIVFLGDGYRASELNAYHNHVQNVIDLFFSTTPYSSYTNYFNVYMVDVTSNQSGADHPLQGIFKDTALNSSYSYGGNVERCLYADALPVFNAADDAPAAATPGLILVIVNDVQYGGCGGSYAVFSIDPSSAFIALHEVGHSFVGLADEYFDSGTTWPGGTPGEPNATTQTIRANIKWNHWINPGTPIPTLTTQNNIPGLYQGASYYEFGIYRPTFGSMMRFLFEEYESVNTEQVVRRINVHARPIDAFSPPEGAISVGAGGRSFSVTPMQPDDHNLTVAWKLNGVTISNNINLTIQSSDLMPGNNTLDLVVSDPTNFVRLDFGDLTDTRTWTLTPAGNQPPVIVPVSDKVVAEGALLSFNVTASDPNGDNITLTAKLSNGNPVTTIGATFNVNGNGTLGAFSWTANHNTSQGAVFTVTFEARDTSNALDSEPATITVTFCGDGHQDAAEQCDDGNTTSGDGCTNLCVDEFCGDGIDNNGSAEACDDGGMVACDGCSMTCQIEACGNSTIDCAESCDDGNTTSGDGCTNLCVDEFCGDSTINDAGAEQCDDGNMNNGDGCDSLCQLEHCGDGALDPGEQCDDNNTTACDGCSASCQNEACGNHRIECAEQCDDGNAVSGDGCTNLCADEFCGDGVINDHGLENCDDSNHVSGDGCSATCRIEFCGDGSINNNGTEQCDDGNSVSGDGCTNLCVDEFCGDGAINDHGLENCDDHNTIACDGCSATCRIEICGNGTRECSEQCDDGNVVASDGCTAGCITEFCGDGLVNNGGLENCDDGNSVSGDGCSATCRNEVCGDGSINNNGSEECDDGNLTACDGCSSACETEACGNGSIECTEACDDGNINSQDGCSSNCHVEFCGDGIRQAGLGEECDDGNSVDLDGCSPTCHRTGVCPNLQCETSLHETCENCWQDCGRCRGGSRPRR